MTIEDIDVTLGKINAQVDALKDEARALVRNRDKLIAQAKIAAMPEAEKAALFALMQVG